MVREGLLSAKLETTESPSFRVFSLELYFLSPQEFYCFELFCLLLCLLQSSQLCSFAFEGVVLDLQSKMNRSSRAEFARDARQRLPHQLQGDPPPQSRVLIAMPESPEPARDDRQRLPHQMHWNVSIQVLGEARNREKLQGELSRQLKNQPLEFFPKVFFFFSLFWNRPCAGLPL